MSEYFYSITDIEQTISDQNIDTNFYVEDWVEIVAQEYCNLLYEKGWDGYGMNEIPEIADDEFWKCFEYAEKEA